MNLLKKNKYSIRKYKVGIFSTLIGTVLLLSNPNGAQALTTDQNVQGESNQALPGNSHNTNVDTSRDITNSSQNTPNQHTTAMHQQTKLWLIIITLVSQIKLCQCQYSLVRHLHQTIIILMLSQQQLSQRRIQIIIYHQITIH